MDAYPVENVGVGGFDVSIGFTPSTWPIGTTLKLCDVPWDQNYRNVSTFNLYRHSAENRCNFQESHRDSYFFRAEFPGEMVEIDRVTYCKPNEPVRVNLPYSKCYKYNYLVVKNPELPVPGEETPPTLYYFITGVSFVAPNTTHLTLQLDVWTTYGPYIEIESAFVERGHVARHAFERTYATATGDAQNQYYNIARRYLVQPEGLDVGNAYMSINEKPRSFIGSGDSAWMIVVASAVQLDVSANRSEWGTVNNPRLPVSYGNLSDELPASCEYWALTWSNFTTFLSTLNGYPWIANNILSLTAVPGEMLDLDSNYIENIGGNVPAYAINSKFKYDGYYYPTPSSNPTKYFTSYYVTNMLEPYYSNDGAVLPEWKNEPKSKVWPFSYLQYENYTGQPIIFKPERFANNLVDDLIYSCAIPPFQRIAIYPSYYGADVAHDDLIIYQKAPAGGVGSSRKHYGETFDNALLWNEFPQFSIINDGYINYLAANAGTLGYARDNAGWQLDRSLASSQTSYDNAMRSMGAAAQNQQLAYNTQRDISRYSMGNLVGNQLRDTFNSLSAGAQGTANQIFGGADVSTIINTTVNASTGATANEVGNMQFQATQRAQAGNIDANYQLQQWAARGDYQQAIAAIDATVQNAQVLPPTFSGAMGGGFLANLAAWRSVYYIISGHTVSRGYQARISRYWQRFGYAVNEYVHIGTNFCIMNYFCYWKAQDVVLNGNVEEGVKEAIRGIFEKGVTIWRDPDDIGKMVYFTPTANGPDTTIGPLY